jgi:MFS family permease
LSAADTVAAARLPRFLWVLALGNLVVGTGGFMIGGIVEPLSRALGVSVSATGQLMTVYSAANAVAAPVLVGLAGRFDARTVLIAAMALLVAANAASALAASWGELALARVAMACGAALFTPTAAALGVALVPMSMRGRALSVSFAGIGLSYVIGVPFGAWAGLSRFGWPLAFWAVAAVGVLVALVLVARAPRGVPTAPASLRRLRPRAGAAPRGARARDHRRLLRVDLLDLQLRRRVPARVRGRARRTSRRCSPRSASPRSSAPSPAACSPTGSARRGCCTRSAPASSWCSPRSARCPARPCRWWRRSCAGA